MAVWIALLRGVNVGSSNRVAMPDLRAHLTELGYGDVRTIVQSGNIVLESDADEATLAAELRHVLADRFAVTTPVVVRSAAELADVVARDPIPEAAADPKRYQVTFLDAPCPADEAAALAAADVAPERLHVSGREIYVWHVDGIQRSPAAALLAKTVSPVQTARNWNTVLKLLDLTAS